MAGIPFIGEEGFYPDWTKWSGRWVFQRTFVSVGGFMADHAEFAAARLSVSDQVIVWVPRKRGLFSSFLPGFIHKERESALQELMGFRLICYGSGCAWNSMIPSMVRAAVREEGIPPEQWRLVCPICTKVAGVDLAPVWPDPIIKKWIALGKPPLENPAASPAFHSASAIQDLPEWITKSDPSHLELAYLGQQMWPTIRDMLEASETAGMKRPEPSPAETGAGLLLALCERFRPSFFIALTGESSGDQAKALTERGSAELLVFALHLTDRIALNRLGNEKRAAFMDAILPAVQRRVEGSLTPALPALYNQRTLFYQSCKMPGGGSNENLKGTLFWEFGKLMASPCDYPDPVFANWNPAAIMQLSLWSMDLMMGLADEFDSARLF